MSLRSRRTMLRLVTGQLFAVVGLAAVLALVVNTITGYSVLVGGLAGVIPNFHFACRLARPAAGDATRHLRHIYTGEFIKIAFTVALFVIAIRMLRVEFMYVILGYAVTVVVNWVAFLFADLGEVHGPLAAAGSELEHGRPTNN